MKKTILCILISLPLIVAAQRYSKQSFVGGSIGGRFFAPLYANLISATVEGNVRITASPSVMLNIDRQIGNRFSFGMSASYSNILFQLDDVTLIEETRDFRLRLNQFSLSIRPLIHYGFNEKSNFYSGIRLGQQYVVISKDPYKDSTLGGKAFFIGTMQIIPVGYRRSINERWGYHLEIGFGAPHSAAFGVQYTPGSKSK